jgi:hypothetical protein
MSMRDSLRMVNLMGKGTTEKDLAIFIKGIFMKDSTMVLELSPVNNIFTMASGSKARNRDKGG